MGNGRMRVDKNLEKGPFFDSTSWLSEARDEEEEEGEEATASGRGAFFF